MKIGDRVNCLAKPMNSYGKYRLADHATDDSAHGYTLKVPCVIQQLFASAGCKNRYYLIPDPITDWEYAGSSGWWADAECLSPIEDAPTIMRSPMVETPTLSCRECGVFAPMAEANCKDGGFACYSCRDTLGWKLKGLLLV